MSCSWVALESNPDVINKYMEKLGISSQLQCFDLLGFDEESISMVPGKAIAVLFLFPMAEEKTRVAQEPENIPSVYFIKQTVGNACGTIALIHALANNHDKIDFGKGCFAKFYEKTKSMSPTQKTLILENDEKMKAAHAVCAEEGDTVPPRAEAVVDFHFLALVNVNGHLYELDGCKNGPIDRGVSSDEDFFKSAVGLCEQYVKLQPNNINFTGLVLATVD